MATKQDRLKVLCAGIFSLVLVLGIARFAYTPLLPAMMDEAGLSHSWGGWLATINYAGYLSGALLAASISDLHIKDRLYRLGLVTAIVTTAAMGLTENIWIWSVMRYFAGLSAAAGLLLGSGLILNWLIRNDFRGELGIHFAGIGLGIAFCAAAVELMEPIFSWDQQWLAFAGMGVLIIFPAWLWLPSPGKDAGNAHLKSLPDNPPSPKFMRLLMAAYFCAGIGYVISATFIVAIIDDLPGLNGQGARTFMIIGLAAAPASILWDFVARRFGYLGALILAYFVHIPAIILPLLLPGVVSAMISAVLFGITFMGIVSLVLTMAGHYYPSHPSKMMGKMTVSYGIAQILAPAFVGQLAGISGDYSTGLYFPAGAVAIGGVILVYLKQQERQQVICST